MTEATLDGEKDEPEARRAEPAQAPEPKTDSAYAEQVNGQDKQKDKPDSGQNEDG